jgi:ABC-type amino acid transport system permease subunit
MDHRRLAAGLVGAFLSSFITFTLFLEAAYFAEIMRRRDPVDPAWPGRPAQALGTTYFQTMGYIVLPQAVRNMLPVLLTQTIILFQGHSLVSRARSPISWARPRRWRNATGAWWRCICSRRRSTS